MITLSSVVDGSYRLGRATRRNPQRRVRALISATAIVAGASILAFGTGVGITFLVFGIFAFMHLSFDMAIGDAERAYAEIVKPEEEEESGQTVFQQFVDTSQTAVITAAATILGLITAFSGGSLPGAAKVAVVGLGGAVLVLLVNRSSQSRFASSKRALRLGIYTDVVGFSLFTLGIIGIIVSLLVTGGLGVQGSGH